MNAKSFGVEINNILEQILVKKASFETLIKRLDEITKERTTELDSLIDEINTTSKNIANTLTKMESLFDDTVIATDSFVKDLDFYNRVLPTLKNKFISIFQNYLELFINYESQIREYIENKIDEIINTQNIQKGYRKNVFNYEIVKNDPYLSTYYNKKYIHPSKGYHWYYGKFYDEYLKKDIDGSLSLFHLENTKIRRVHDFLGNSGNNIYEHIMYHPDYGMLYYRSIGRSENMTNYHFPTTQVLNHNIEIVVDDDFKGEFSEVKNRITSWVRKDAWPETQSKNTEYIPMGMELTHISTKTDKDKQNMSESYFIHKINIQNDRISRLPHYFFIGQNKDIHAQANFTQTFTKNDNTTDTFLNPNRRTDKLYNGNIVMGYRKTWIKSSNDSFYMDNDETINLDKNSTANQISVDLNGFEGGIESYYILNYRGKKLSLLSSVSNKVNNALNISYWNTNDGLDLMDRGIVFLGYTKRNKTNHFKKENGLFTRWYPFILHHERSVQNVYTDSRINREEEYNRAAPRPVGIIMSGHPIEIVQDMNLGMYIGSQIRCSSDFYRMNIASIRLNYRLFRQLYHYNIEVVNWNIQQDNTGSDNPNAGRYTWRITYNESFYPLVDDIGTLNKYWYYSDYDNNITNYHANDCNFALIDPQGKDSNIVTGKVVNLIDSKRIFQRDINNIVSELLEELTELQAEPIGTLKYIPYSIESPKTLFNGTYAKAGSVLNKKDYPEAYKVFGDKYILEASEVITSSEEFAIPNFENKYLIGGDSSNIMEIDEDAIPKFDLEIGFDSATAGDKTKYTGIITKEHIDEESVVGVHLGEIGKGGQLTDLEINHKSTASVTKGNDFRTDIYIRVK